MSLETLQVERQRENIMKKRRKVSKNCGTIAKDVICVMGIINPKRKKEGRKEGEKGETDVGRNRRKIKSKEGQKEGRQGRIKGR
jgi:hypothetical protein